MIRHFYSQIRINRLCVMQKKAEMRIFMIDFSAVFEYNQS